MGHGSCTFKEADLRKALTAARKAGVLVRVEIEPGKKLAVTMIGEQPAEDEANEWDEWYEQKTSTKVR